MRGIGKSKDDTWYVYRRGNALVDPDTNQTLAYEAIYLGTAQLTRPGDPATVALTDTCRRSAPATSWSPPAAAAGELRAARARARRSRAA